MSLSPSEIQFLERVRQGSRGKKWASDNVEWADGDSSTFHGLRANGYVEGQSSVTNGLQVRLTYKGRDALVESAPLARRARWWAARGTNALDAIISHVVALIIGVAIGYFGPGLVEAVKGLFGVLFESG